MDKRLCDKGELLVAFNTSEYGKPERAEEWTFPNKLAVQIVEDMPEVDAVEVVRCKYCAKRHTAECLMEYECVCGAQYSWESDDEFCSGGVRKTDD